MSTSKVIDETMSLSTCSPVVVLTFRLIAAAAMLMEMFPTDCAAMSMERLPTLCAVMSTSRVTALLAMLMSKVTAELAMFMSRVTVWASMLIGMSTSDPTIWMSSV